MTPRAFGIGASLLFCLTLSAPPAAPAQALPPPPKPVPDRVPPMSVSPSPPVDESGQKPPPDTDVAEIQPKDCVKTDTDFVDERGTSMFRVTLRNLCKKRSRCTVHAYVVTAFGPSSGRRVLTLSPVSKEGAVKSYAIAIKQAAGMANVSLSCVEF